MKMKLLELRIIIQNNIFLNEAERFKTHKPKHLGRHGIQPEDHEWVSMVKETITQLEKLLGSSSNSLASFKMMFDKIYREHRITQLRYDFGTQLGLGHKSKRKKTLLPKAEACQEFMAIMMAGANELEKRTKQKKKDVDHQRLTKLVIEPMRRLVQEGPDLVEFEISEPSKEDYAADPQQRSGISERDEGWIRDVRRLVNLTKETFQTFRDNKLPKEKTIAKLNKIYEMGFDRAGGDDIYSGDLSFAIEGIFDILYDVIEWFGDEDEIEEDKLENFYSEIDLLMKDGPDVLNMQKVGSIEDIEIDDQGKINVKPSKPKSLSSPDVTKKKKTIH